MPRGKIRILETILARATVPILAQLADSQPELGGRAAPSLVRTMLTAFVEVMAEEERGRP